MDKVVDYLVYEQSQVRADRRNRRSFIIILVLIIALVGSNAGWLYYESQYVDMADTTTVTQQLDSENGLAIINDGVHINGENNTDSN